MKHKLFLTFLVVLPLFTMAQLRITIENLPERTNLLDGIFFSSNINSWDPADSSYVFVKNSEGNYVLDIAEVDDLVSYKITRGSWKKVECDIDGNDISNRTISKNDTVVSIDITAWKDAYLSKKGPRSENVHIIDSLFVIPDLNRHRKVWVYLPESYANTDKSYPVIYMHDGQNLFDSSTSYAGEWEVDETLDRIIAEGAKEAIIIGVENGGKYRVDEYTPFINKDHGGGNARAYMKFIVNDVKKYVDENYRTKAERENTYLMGSSLGGLVSFYAVMSFKSVFSKAVVMSPSFWFSDRIYYIPSAQYRMPIGVYFVAGELEGSQMIPNMEKMYNKMLDLNYTDDQVFIKKVKDGQHNEKLWKEEFEEAYNWLLK